MYVCESPSVVAVDKMKMMCSVSRVSREVKGSKIDLFTRDRTLQKYEFK